MSTTFWPTAEHWSVEIPLDTPHPRLDVLGQLLARAIEHDEDPVGVAEILPGEELEVAAEHPRQPHVAADDDRVAVPGRVQRPEPDEAPPPKRPAPPS